MLHSQLPPYAISITPPLLFTPLPWLCRRQPPPRRRHFRRRFHAAERCRRFRRYAITPADFAAPLLIFSRWLPPLFFAAADDAAFSHFIAEIRFAAFITLLSPAPSDER